MTRIVFAQNEVYFILFISQKLLNMKIMNSKNEIF